MQRQANKGLGLVIATNFLSLDQATLRFWNDFHRDLEPHGLSLLMLSTTDVESATFPVLSIPYHLAGFAHWFGMDGAAGAAEAPWTAEVISSAVAADRGPDREKIHAGAYAAFSFFSDLLTTLEPTAVFAWNGMHSSTQVLLGVTRLLGIPAWAAERGWIRDTMMFDLGENSALAEWACSVPLRQWLKAAQADEDLFERLRIHHLANRRGRYGSQPALAPDEARHALGLSEHGSVWATFTHGGPGIDAGETRAGLHATSPDALDHQLAVAAQHAAQRGAVLLVQEHPINRALGITRPRAIAAGARFVEGNIHTLLGLADLTLHTVSTLQFDALFYRRPLVMLCRSLLSLARIGGGPGPIEVGIDGSLTECLDKAAAFTNWDARQRSLERFASIVARFQLVDMGLGLVPTTTSDVADIVGSLMRPVPTDLDSRIEGFLLRWQRVA
jgi:hypothetical protein